MRVFPLAIKIDYTVVLEYVKIPKPSAATLWWLLATIVGLVVLFIAYDAIARRIRKKRARQRSETDFKQLALVCRLDPDEVNLLKHLIGICEVELPDRLFTSFELFNSCLEEHGPGASGPITEADAKRLRLIRNKIFFGERSQLPPIRTTHELKSNQWLHLRRISSGEVFMAPVVEAGTSGLLVSTPRIDKEYIKLEAGEAFEVYFWRDRDASYHFKSEVVGQTGSHYIITTLKHVEDVERIQRRQFHRIDTSIRVSAIPVPREELDKINQGEPVDTKGHPGLRAYVVDISGAGFALAAHTALNANDLVYLEIPGDGGKGSPIPVIGKILNITRRELTDESLMHAEFVGLSAARHEKIFQLIYAHAGNATLAGA
jgi:c-di-GMP-binding flagellar brake protein YcgR